MTIRGLGYPLALSRSGGLEVVEDYPTLVKQAIFHAIQTIKGELVWYPRSGRDWLVFQSTSNVATILQSLRGSIQDSLEGYPGVNFELLGGFTEENRLSVVVNYRVPDQEPSKLQVEVKL
jgi:hypothetical protein